MAEAIKHGVIADEAYFHWMMAHGSALVAPGLDAAMADRLVRDSVAVKVGVVAGDEREGGRRKILNFGHTIGHAVEHLSGYALLHGDAVAIGMVAEARLGELAGVTLPGLADDIASACAAMGLPTTIDASFAADAIVDATRGDKKTRGGQVEYALPTRLGAMNEADGRFALPMADALVHEAIAASR
jgi:3-dehydroquinate synthase